MKKELLKLVLDLVTYELRYSLMMSLIKWEGRLRRKLYVIQLDCSKQEFEVEGLQETHKDTADNFLVIVAANHK
jgi:hypothetical protein